MRSLLQIGPIGAAVLVAVALWLSAAPVAAAADVVRTVGHCRLVLPAGHEGLADGLADVCGPRAARLFAQLGVGEALAVRPVEVRIVEEPRQLDGRAPAGVRLPDWSQAAAFAEQGVVVLALHRRDGGPLLDVSETLAHELSHLALRAAVRGRPVPRWLAEGVAVQQSELTSFFRLYPLRARLGTDSRIRPSLYARQFPAHATEALVAYAVSADFVGHLLREKGWEGMRRLLAGVGAGRPFEQTLLATYGASLARLERDWRDRLDRQFDFVTIIASSTLVWGLATVLFLAAFVTVRNRQRRRLAEMEREEAPLEQVIDVVQAIRRPRTPVAPGASPPPSRSKVLVDGRFHTLH